jgi:hypothetical protein
MKFRIVFWDILPCKIIVDRRFRGTCCLHHQGWKLLELLEKSYSILEKLIVAQLVKKFTAIYGTKSCLQYSTIYSYPKKEESYFYRTHAIHLTSILILSSHLRLYVTSGLSFWLWKQICFTQFSSPPACYMARPFHPRFEHPNSVWRRVQSMEILIMQFLHPPDTLSLLGSNIPLSTLFSNTLSLCSYEVCY